MINVLILEDNLITSDALKKVIYDSEKETRVFVANKLSVAYSIVVEEKIDLFLIDIVLNSDIAGDVSGLEFASRIRKLSDYKLTHMIFITSLVDEKMFSYRQLHCYSYIEKPFDIMHIKDMLKELLLGIKNNKKQLIDKSKEEVLFIRKRSIIYPIKIDDIIFIESHSASTIIHTIYESIKVSNSIMKEHINKLPKHIFVKCNRSDIINIEYIDKIELSAGKLSLRNIKTEIYITLTGKRNLSEAMQL